MCGGFRLSLNLLQCLFGCWCVCSAWRRWVMTCFALVGSPSVCGTAQRSSSCASLTRKVTIVYTCMLVCVHVHTRECGSTSTLYVGMTHVVLSFLYIGIGTSELQQICHFNDINKLLIIISAIFLRGLP